MKDLWKKNQLMITALAIMIAIAGYLQFSEKTVEEEYLPVSSDMEMYYEDDGFLEDLEVADVGEAKNEDSTIESTPGEAVFTSAGGMEVLTDARLLKEQTRAKNKETLMEVLNTEGLDEAQKREAVDSIVKMTTNAEMEAAAEMLLEAKGFMDVVVSITEQAVDVVVNATELSDVERAQIEDIIVRKTKVEPENIIISTVAE